MTGQFDWVEFNRWKQGKSFPSTRQDRIRKLRRITVERGATPAEARAAVDGCAICKGDIADTGNGFERLAATLTSASALAVPALSPEMTLRKTRRCFRSACVR